MTTSPCQIKYRNCVIEDPVATALTNFKCKLVDIQKDFGDAIINIQGKLSILDQPLTDAENKLKQLYLVPTNPTLIPTTASRLATLPTECEVYLVGTKIIFKGDTDITCLRKLFECLAGPPDEEIYVSKPTPKTVTKCSSQEGYSASASGSVDVSTSGIDISAGTSVSKTKSTKCTTTTTIEDPVGSTYVEWMDKLLQSSRSKGVLVVYTDLQGHFLGANKPLKRMALEAGLDVDIVVSWIFWINKGESGPFISVNKDGFNQLQKWGFDELRLTQSISGDESDVCKVCTLTDPDIIYRLRKSVNLTDGEIEMLMRMSDPEKIKLTSSASDLRAAVNKLSAQHPNWTDKQARSHISTCIDYLWRSINVSTIVNTQQEIDNLFAGCAEFGLAGSLVGEFTADILAPIAAAIEAINNTVEAMIALLKDTINDFLDRLEALINALSGLFGIDISGEVGGSLWDCLFKLEFNLGLGILVVVELEAAIDTLFVELYGLWGLIGLAITPIVLALNYGKDFVRDLAGGLTIVLGIPCITVGIDLPFCIRIFLDIMFDLMAALTGILEKGSANLGFKAHILANIIAEMKLGWSFSIDFNLEGGFLIAAILTI